MRPFTYHFLGHGRMGDSQPTSWVWEWDYQSHSQTWGLHSPWRPIRYIVIPPLCLIPRPLLGSGNETTLNPLVSHSQTTSWVWEWDYPSPLLGSGNGTIPAHFLGLGMGLHSILSCLIPRPLLGSGNGTTFNPLVSHSQTTSWVWEWDYIQSSLVSHSQTTSWVWEWDYIESKPLNEFAERNFFSLCTEFVLQF